MAVVNSLASKLRKTVHSVPESTQAATPEETVARKQKLLGIVDKATDTFLKNLENSQVTLDSAGDLEKLAKITLLLSGEADTIKGTVGHEESQEVQEKELKMKELESVLNLEDDSVRDVYNKIFNKMNSDNDSVD